MMIELTIHQPVLLHEVVSGLDPQAGETALDATLGGGGHALAITEHLGKTGLLIGLDADSAALKRAGEKLQGVPCQLKLVQDNFRNLAELLQSAGVTEIDLALFDLGFSSDQLASSGRGFSFQTDEPLLMTFSDQTDSDSLTSRLTAQEIVNEWSEASLADIIYGWGEETFSRQIANAIVLARRREAIKTTGQLVEVIRTAVPEWYTHKRLHFATRTFQALRLATNDELGALKSGLEQVWKLLSPNGRLAVISFHSLEARLLKKWLKEKVINSEGELVTKHAIKPTRAETLQNPRARSAQLKIIKKL